MTKINAAASHNQSAPLLWSQALVWAGFLLLVVCETMSAVGQFHTASRSVLFLGLPVDALGKVSMAVVIGFGAYGGAICAAWLWTHPHTSYRRLATIAVAATLALFGLAVFNQATYFGWARRTAEYPQVAASPEYAQALAAYTEVTRRLAGDPMGYEEEDAALEAQARALAVIKRGQKPTGSELPGPMDWFKGFAAYAIIELMAAGFRLPIVAQPKAKAARGQSKSRSQRDGNVVAIRK